MLVQRALAICVAISLAPATSALSHDLAGRRAQSALEAKLTPELRQQLRANEDLRQPGAAEQLVQDAIKKDAVMPQGGPAQGAPPQGAPARQKAIAIALEQVANSLARWHQRTTIKVCFLDGSQASAEKFLDVMDEEISLTNLQLDRTYNVCPSKGAQIRVSFQQPGFWSYIGTDALLIPAGEPTLNLSNMGDNGFWSNDSIGTARHEIGHALGLLHEHQNPLALACDFKSDQEIADLIGWPLSDVQTNFDRLKSGPGLIVTAYDPTSVMHYQLPGSYFQNPNSACALAHRNNTLSPADRSILKSMYPAH